MTKLSNLSKVSSVSDTTKLVSSTNGGGYITVSDITSGVKITRLSNRTQFASIKSVWKTGDWWRITNGETISAGALYAAIMFDIPCGGYSYYMAFGVDDVGRGLYSCGTH